MTQDGNEEVQGAGNVGRFIERGEATGDCQGGWRVQNGMITVSCIHGSKTTQIGNSPHNALARLIFSEILHTDIG